MMYRKDPKLYQIDDAIENRTCNLEATNHAAMLSLDDLTRHSQDLPFGHCHSAKLHIRSTAAPTVRSTYVVRDGTPEDELKDKKASSRIACRCSSKALVQYV